VTRRFGYLPDAPDARDTKLGSLLGKLAASPPPASASVWNAACPIRDQGFTSSCVGHAWARALRLAYLRAGMPCPELSPLYTYLLARAQHGGEGEDVGTYLRSGGKATVKFGAADEAAWPFNETKVNVQPNLRALHNGYDRKGLRSYARIDSGDPDDVRRAIAAGHPVVAGWQISQSFVDWNGDGVIGKQREPIVGGHALCVVSYAADGTFTLANSWGPSWASKGGFAIVDEGFIEQNDDAWAVSVT
jgi:C1A family cysteine protease